MRVVDILPAAALLPTAFSQLHKAASAHGKYFGSATDNYELADEPYKEILLTPGEFGQITPSNLQKWFSSEPSPGVFNFTGGDQIAKIADEHDMLFRCHPLVWHSQLPSWGMF
jgi:endo-1,4-beta-xylanase